MVQADHPRGAGSVLTSMAGKQEVLAQSPSAGDSSTSCMVQPGFVLGTKGAEPTLHFPGGDPCAVPLDRQVAHTGTREPSQAIW